MLQDYLIPFVIHVQWVLIVSTHSSTLEMVLRDACFHVTYIFVLIGLSTNNAIFSVPDNKKRQKNMVRFGFSGAGRLEK